MVLTVFFYEIKLILMIDI